MSDLSKIPCTIVTGFLGAGKTTLVRHLLENAGGRRLAVARQRVRRSRLRRLLHRGLRHQRLHRGGHRRTAERLHLLHRRGRFRPGPQQAPRPAERAGAHPDRDLGPRLAEAARHGLQLAGDPLPRHGGRRRRGGRRPGGRRRLLRRRSASPCRSARRRQVGRARQSARRGLRGPAPVRRPDPAQQDRSDGRRPSSARVQDEIARAPAALGEGRRDGARAARSRPGARPRTLPPKPISPRAPRITTTAEDHDHDDFESIAVPVEQRRRPEALMARVERAAEARGVLRIKGFAPVEGKPLRLVVQGVGRRVAHHFDRPWKQGEAAGRPPRGDRPQGFRPRQRSRRPWRRLTMHLLPVTTVSLDDERRRSISASRRATSWCSRSPTATSALGAARRLGVGGGAVAAPCLAAAPAPSPFGRSLRRRDRRRCTLRARALPRRPGILALWRRAALGSLPGRRHLRSRYCRATTGRIPGFAPIRQSPTRLVRNSTPISARAAS